MEDGDWDSSTGKRGSRDAQHTTIKRLQIATLVFALLAFLTAAAGFALTLMVLLQINSQQFVVEHIRRWVDEFWNGWLPKSP